MFGLSALSCLSLLISLWYSESHRGVTAVWVCWAWKLFLLFPSLSPVLFSSLLKFGRSSLVLHLLLLCFSSVITQLHQCQTKWILPLEESTGKFIINKETKILYNTFKNRILRSSFWKKCGFIPSTLVLLKARKEEAGTWVKKCSIHFYPCKYLSVRIHVADWLLQIF